MGLDVWVDREGRMNLGGVGGRVKTHCTKFSNNKDVLKTKFCFLTIPYVHIMCSGSPFPILSFPSHPCHLPLFLTNLLPSLLVFVFSVSYRGGRGSPGPTTYSWSLGNIPGERVTVPIAYTLLSTPGSGRSLWDCVTVSVRLCLIWPFCPLLSSSVDAPHHSNITHSISRSCALSPSFPFGPS